MSNPYNWNFPQRNETMFLATIQSTSRPLRQHVRTSSFLKKDIPGAQNKTQIPEVITRDNFAHSAYIEPIPNSHVMKNKFIATNSLRTDDIQYAQPHCSQFKSNRITNPLIPRYKLPYVPPVNPEPPRKFIRDSIDISDLQTKNPSKLPKTQKNEPIQGASPSKLFRTVQAVNRLDVKDINKDGLFVSKRTENPANPLEPFYTWRETRMNVNDRYGDIGNKPKEVIPHQVKKQQDMSLSTYDIEGARANSYNERKYFFSKRNDYRDSLDTTDIAKTQASSLKKGISTMRHVNPLTPQYKYPQPC